MNRYIITFLLSIISFSMSAQFYNSGQDASNIKWRQINNDNFKIVYPENSDSIAEYIASALMWAYEHSTEDMNHKPRKIGVILHPEASTSNGMVTWAPKRMELFSTPPMNNYPQDWFEQLAIHEYRHVIQIDKLNQGLTRFLYFIFGEQAIGGVLGGYVPLWFLEGDAVWAETNYSLTGRGRQVSFSDPLKVQVLQKGIYSYDKATMGSYNNFIPDHYILGYNLVNEVRKEFGDSVWSKTIDFVARNPYMIVPFSRGLKKNTGYRKVKLYNHIMDGLQKEWISQVKSNGNFNHKLVYYPLYRYSSNDQEYDDYSFPYMVHDSVFIALKKTLGKTPQIVEIDTRRKKKKESKLVNLGYSEFYNISYQDSMLCWEEIRFDPRWNHKRYHVVLTYNFHSKKVKQLTKKTKYFSPEFNHNATKIACFEIESNNKYALIILDSKTGEVLQNFSIPYMISTPVWRKDDSEIYFVKQGNEGHSIQKIDLKTGEIKQVSKPDYFAKKIQWVSNDTIYFISEYSGADNLYSIRENSDEILKITSAPFSINAVTLNINGDLNYDFQTARGGRIMSYPLKNALNQPVELKSNFNDSVFKYDSSYANMQMDGFKIQKFESKPYRKAAHLFNLHSWGPISISGTTLETRPSFSISSQNLLGTSTFTAGHNYSLNYGTHNTNVKYIYSGFYPEFELEYNRIQAPIERPTGDLFVNVFSSRAILPLNFTKRNIIKNISPYLGIRYQIYKFQTVNTVDNRNGNDYYYGLSFRFQKRMAHRDLYPRLGVAGNILQSLNYQLSNEISAANLYIYLPGFALNHSIRLYAASQVHDDDFLALSFGDLISLARGYVDISGRKMSSFKADYSLPLAYPDAKIGSFYYLKRIRANAFFDYTSIEINSPWVKSNDYTSWGVDIILDGHFFRLITPVNLGLRTVWLGDRRNIGFSLILGINIP